MGAAFANGVGFCDWFGEFLRRYTKHGSSTTVLRRNNSRNTSFVQDNLLQIGPKKGQIDREGNGHGFLECTRNNHIDYLEKLRITTV